MEWPLKIPLKVSDSIGLGWIIKKLRYATCVAVSYDCGLNWIVLD